MNARQTVEALLARADVRINGTRSWDIRVHNEAWYRRVLAESSLGLGESYMDGWWDAEKLDEFFYRFLSARLEHAALDKWGVYNALKARLLNMQTTRRSKRVAKQHYDLGNEFYEKMLDPHMQYTCAYWKRADSLEEAQEHKLDLICQKLQIEKGDRVLELGCGWGGFARYAARHYGCSVVAHNISEEQVAYARRWNEGLPVEIVQGDYRDARGEFDKVAAIGICEHVGYKNYRHLMEVAHRAVKPHGLFLLHSIAGNASVATSDPWFDKYIFPGGMLPSVAQLGTAMENLFVMEDWHNLGPDYDKTLMAWQENVDRHWEQLQPTYGQRFYRMWSYYLQSLAGAFRARKVQLWQIVMSKSGVVGGYQSVR